MKENLKPLLSTLKAIARLCLVSHLFFIDGLKQVIFERREIVDYDYIFTYLSDDEDKISYIDKLNENVYGDDLEMFPEYNEDDYEDLN
jgi:hypothetical protein